MTRLTIVAVIMVDPTKVDAIKPLFKLLIAETLSEAGCVQYDLHQDNQDPSRFLFFETWATRELWQDHMSAPHVKAFQSATDGILTSVELFEMTLL
ncbi:MAG: quinol monooxygenase YgiN [Reinekea sp.]|jgi:quinol monooxygenase YgiN